MEFFVHHEDVRRAQPDWQPRDLPAGLNAALWARLPLIARLTLRRLPARGCGCRRPATARLAVGPGRRAVRVVGAPAELVLFFSGRQRVARVQLDGDEALVARLQRRPAGHLTPRTTRRTVLEPLLHAKARITHTRTGSGPEAHSPSLARRVS